MNSSEAGDPPTESSTAPVRPLVRRPVRQRMRVDSAVRIVDAAVNCLVAEGLAAFSMHSVAAKAGVSKALIHYHFRDREALLVAVIAHVTAGIITRERETLEAGTAQTAIDNLWTWLFSEVRLGHMRLLLELGRGNTPGLQRALDASRTTRRAAMVVSVEELFTLLELGPHIPLELVSDMILVFVNGLVMQSGDAAPEELRVVFDVFWLSVLRLSA